MTYMSAIAVVVLIGVVFAVIVWTNRGNWSAAERPYSPVDGSDYIVAQTYLGDDDTHHRGDGHDHGGHHFSGDGHDHGDHHVDVDGHHGV